MIAAYRFARAVLATTAEIIEHGLIYLLGLIIMLLGWLAIATMGILFIYCLFNGGRT